MSNLRHNRLYFNIFVLLLFAVILLLMLSIVNYTWLDYYSIFQCPAIPVTRDSKFAHLPRIKCREDLAKTIQAQQ